MRLRLATMDDAGDLLRWRNDPFTRAMSKTAKEVAIDEHFEWLRARIGSLDPVYIFEDNQGRSVGTANIKGDRLSYTVAPEHRGRGIAALMLSWIRAKHGSLLCEIKKLNTASIKAARASGHRVALLDNG